MTIAELPLATNTCPIQVDQIPQTNRLEAIDIQLPDPADWGGSRRR